MPASRLTWSWRVFLTCWAVQTLFWTPYIVREHFPALTLAEQGTLNVERYLGWTDDIFPGPHGGAFINNNPGASLTGAIPLVLLRPWLVRVDEWDRQHARPGMETSDGVFRRSVKEGRALYFLLVAFLTVALVMAPATAGTAAYLCSRACQAGLSPACAAAAAVLYGLGTPVLFRAGGLNHNLLVSDAGFIALLLLWDPDGRPLSFARAAGAGLLAGYALFCDYSGVVVVAIAALYVWLRSARSQKLRVGAAYLAGLAPAVAGLAAYQAWAFGSLYRPSQHYMTPTAPTSMGYRGFSWPSPALAWANFFDPRFGLFVYCPLLLLAFLAPFVAGKRDPIPRRETWVLLIYFGLLVLFCAANQYSWLQPLTGFRYLVPIVPGLAILAMQASRIFPPAVRWILAMAAMGQSLIVAAAHQNDLRTALGSLYRRRFALLWMTHLADAGIPAGWVNAASALLVLLALTVSAWFCVRLWEGRTE
jgi:hypothetical protein